MDLRSVRRLAAAPIYVAVVSLTGTATLTFVAADGVQGWFGGLGGMWSSWAAVPFVLGSLLVAGAAVELARRDRIADGVVAGLLGNAAVFYVSARAFARTLRPEASFGVEGGEGLVALLILGSPGIIVGASAPVLWGRWEARREETQPSDG